MKEYRRNSGYRALFNAGILTSIGNSLFNIVFVVYASQQPFNKLAIMLASLTMFIPVFLDVWMGHLADQTLNKKRWMVISRLLQGLLFILLAFLVTLPSSIALFLTLLVINVVSDCLGDYGNGLRLPYFKSLVATEELDAVMGFQMSATTLVQLIFQGLGGWVIVWLNYEYQIFGFINAFFFFSAALVLFIHQKDFILKEVVTPLAVTEGGQKLSFKSNIKETMVLLNKNILLKMVLIMALLVNLFGTSITGLLNISLLDLGRLWFQSYAQTISLIGVSLSVGLIIGSIWTNDFFKNWEINRLIRWALLVMIAFPLNLLFIQSRVLLFVNLLVLGYFLGKVNPRFSATLIRDVPQEKLAITGGIFQTIVMIGGPVGQLIFLGSANLLNSTVSWSLFLVLSFVVLFFTVSIEKDALKKMKESQV
ncbi:MFS transporter [Vagococcus sp.]|uniref:MFS transporter n=1 Tax=Vagococcus sp. TaxID=1933889 RepID=UPI003F962B81